MFNKWQNKIWKKRFWNIMQCMQQGSEKELQEIRGLMNRFCLWSYLFLMHTSICLCTVRKQKKILWMGISAARGPYPHRELTGRVEAQPPGCPQHPKGRPPVQPHSPGDWDTGAEPAPSSWCSSAPAAGLLLSILRGRRDCTIKIWVSPVFWDNLLRNRHLEMTYIFHCEVI